MNPGGGLPNPWLRGLAAYVPGEQTGEARSVKLNTNEFPYPAAPEVLEAIRASATDAVRLYPSARCDELRERLAARHGVEPANVLVANGSDEILRLAIQAHGGRDRMTATVGPTYSLYPTLVEAIGGTIQVFKLDGLREIPESIFDTSPDLILLANPNAPIGNVFDDVMVNNLSKVCGVLLLDEAYIDFANDDKLISLQDRPNIVHSRTFSKSFGLAGMRVGYAVAPAGVIEVLSKIADSYNVNRISQAAAIAALDAEHYYAGRVATIRESRAWLTEELRGRGFEVTESHANFLFARRPDAERLYRALAEKGILVRYFDVPELADGIRISIGTREELESLLAALDELL